MPVMSFSGQHRFRICPGLGDFQEIEDKDVKEGI